MHQTCLAHNPLRLHLCHVPLARLVIVAVMILNAVVVSYAQFYSYPHLYMSGNFFDKQFLLISFFQSSSDIIGALLVQASWILVPTRLFTMIE